MVPWGPRSAPGGMVSQPVSNAATAKPPTKIRFVLIFLRKLPVHVYSKKIAHRAPICKSGLGMPGSRFTLSNRRDGQTAKAVDATQLEVLGIAHKFGGVF